MRRALALIALLALVAGCEFYGETVSCGNGTVLNDDDECVRPPPPDGSVPVESCDDLCALAAGLTAEQLGCVQGILASSGPPPAACMVDLASPAACSACVGALMATDPECAAVGAACQ